MNKPKIFLSHITEEADFASAFRSEIESSFLGMVDVFQSSSQNSLRVGRNWLNDITEALRDCQAIIVFCSPYSVGRPWINFECGAGWARDIEVVPVCHSGTRPVDLPVPINLLQGIEGDDASKLQQIFDMIASKLGAQSPCVDTRELARKIHTLSLAYVEEVEITKHVRTLKSINLELFNIICTSPANVVQAIEGVPQLLVERCRQPFEALQTRGKLQYGFNMNAVAFGGPGGGGNLGTLSLQLDMTLVELFKKVADEEEA
ncbi:toll/interleukin-1 receptor domain-containing protein [Pseudovibrio sp. SCP19]|uniref:toll/interleukin-1 receptor domain-containing protein n=1 Tax=Pseudovibrio sp. SCP19 TaxID=3141374 RepID=UPI00333A2139